MMAKLFGNYDQYRETFVKIEGYDNYEISNYGELLCTYTGGILKSTDNGGGYLKVKLTKNGKAKNYKIHRLVGLAFFKNPDKKECIDHIDNCRTFIIKLEMGDS